MPNGLADDIRSDIVSEIYLAVLEGTLPENQILSHGRTILNRVAKFCGVDFHHRTFSLDEHVNDGGVRFVDLLEDEGALAAFDRIFDDDFDE